jgi:hypothetical protein
MEFDVAELLPLSVNETVHDKENSLSMTPLDVVHCAQWHQGIKHYRQRG